MQLAIADSIRTMAVSSIFFRFFVEISIAIVINNTKIVANIVIFSQISVSLQIKKCEMAKEQTGIKERQRTDLREPRRYKVTIYNDDFTTMEFVVKVLVEVFFYF